MMMKEDKRKDRKGEVGVDEKEKDVPKTHQDHRAYKDDVGEKVAWLGEATCFELKLTAIGP